MMTFTEAIAALAAELGVAATDDGRAVADALRARYTHKDSVRGSSMHAQLRLVEAEINRRNGAEAQAAYLTTGLLLLMAIEKHDANAKGAAS